MIKQVLLVFIFSFTLYNCNAQVKMLFGTGNEFRAVAKGDSVFWEIIAVEKGSSAWYAGFMPGDVLRSILFDGRLVKCNYRETRNNLSEFITGDFNTDIEIGITREDNPEAPVLYAHAHFTTFLSASPQAKTNGRVTGDCMNGKGGYIDSAGNVYSGTFLNGKLNGPDCEILMGDGSYYYSGSFENGLKNGYGSIQYGQHRLGSVSTANGYFGDFKNDQPHGKGYITLLNGNTYGAEYENGKIKGYVTYTFNNGNYCFCDAADNYKPVECYNIVGSAIGALEVPE